MREKTRRIFAVLISLLPFNSLRCLLYKVLLGYRIEGSRIGWGTLIVTETFTIQNASMGRFNQFAGPMHVAIHNGAGIGSRNTFVCGDWTAAKSLKEKNYERSLEIGQKTLITNNHFFDIAGRFHLGNESWIAGRDSQFWTHGADIIDRNIIIGESCYLGSAVRFAPGSGIGDNVIVGIGSVVTARFEVSNALIAGVPAKIIKENYDWKQKKKVDED